MIAHKMEQACNGDEEQQKYFELVASVVPGFVFEQLSDLSALIKHDNYCNFVPREGFTWATRFCMVRAMDF